MTTIRAADLVTSVADCLQHISCFHPPDFLSALAEAWRRETSPAAREALTQLLANSRICATTRRPICQDTGIVTVLARIGMDVRWDDTTRSFEELIDEGVRSAWRHPRNPLRASILADPAGERRNTRDNTPAMVHCRLVPGNTVEVEISAKGGGSEAQSRFANLPPAASVEDWVVGMVPGMGAGWCPPGVLGIGIGGTPDMAMHLAREALSEPIDMPQLQRSGPATKVQERRMDLYKRINDLGIGAQGYGGLTTVLDVKIRECPTHAATLPVALIPSCVATRRGRFTLAGEGPARFDPPDLSRWPDVSWTPSPNARRVDLEGITREEIATWRAGDSLLLSGRLLTGRDAAHRRLCASLERGEPLPVDLRNRFLYYVGPVDPVDGEVIGPAGPTTAKRMDSFLGPLLERTGLLGTIGKGERSSQALRTMRDHGAVYLTAVGGAAALLAGCVRQARVLAFPDLGMEAIYEFDVSEMPVTVAVDSGGGCFPSRPG